MTDASLREPPAVPNHGIVTILPCSNIAASTAFYAMLGLFVTFDYGAYKILSDGKGWDLHLSAEGPADWIVPGRNPLGLYFYVEDVDGIAARAAALFIAGHGPALKPWGMYEFALSDPDGTLVRIGWPGRGPRG